MTNDEAKFILCAYRPSGVDAADPYFAGALAQARLDPTLGRWFSNEQALDGATGTRVRAVAPPAGLREAILAGAKASRRTHWWQHPAVFALAACLVVAAVALVTFVRAEPSIPTERLLAFVSHDLDVTHRTMEDRPPGAMVAWLSDAHNPLRGGVPMSAEQLRRDGCRTISVAKVELFEVCFTREHSLHLYIAPRSAIAADLRETIFREQGAVATATWADQRFVYVLATEAGLSALKSVL